jgi:L-lactate dehydrogenase (FMN-dependent) and related alpha-hydroxy acid dehydrogenases
MNYSEVIENAKNNIGPNCKVCPVCNGLGCGNIIPGPGSKAPGNGAHDNWQSWQKYRLEMDTITHSMTVDTSVEFLGRRFSAPLIAAPVGDLSIQFTPESDIREYNDDVLKACAFENIIGTFGDGLFPTTLTSALESTAKYKSASIPVLNPLSNPEIIEKIDETNKYNCFALSVVVDSAGLPHLRKSNPNAGVKSIEDLAALKAHSKLPFIVKGVMNAKAAEKAVISGADAIVVSNHGGRVLPYCPATADVLPEIVQAVGDRTKIIVDGGIRSGADIFKALALGADMVMVCRPFLISWFGGKSEGVSLLIQKLKAELSEAMYMCGAENIGEVDLSMLRRISG